MHCKHYKMVNKTGTTEVKTADKTNREDVKILYELNVLLKSRSFKKDSENDGFLSYEFFLDWFNQPHMKYEDIDSGGFKIERRNLKIHEISLLKNIDKNVNHEYRRIKSFARQRNIILRINIPIQTDFYITAETFAFKLIDKIYGDRELIIKIDKKHSAYEQFDVKFSETQSTQKQSAQNQGAQDQGAQNFVLQDNDAKLAALFCHYAYFYLDYLELQTLHSSFFNKLKKNDNILRKSLIYYMSRLKNGTVDNSEYVQNFSIKTPGNNHRPETAQQNRDLEQKVSDFVYSLTTNASELSYDAVDLTITILQNSVKYATYPITIPLKKIFELVRATGDDAKKNNLAIAIATLPVKLPYHTIKAVLGIIYNSIIHVGKEITHEFDENVTPTNDYNTSRISWGGANKILYRIFNRLHEIYSIVTKDASIKFDESITGISFQVEPSDVKHKNIARIIDSFFNSDDRIKEYIRQSINSSLTEERLIYKAFTESKEYPVDFYELYDMFKYWEYLKKSANNADDIINEAKEWHIVHLGSKNSAKHNIISDAVKDYDFIKIAKITTSNEKHSLNDRIPFHCTTEKVRYGWYHGFTGYGGALFVRIGDGSPTKFVFSTKGTDVNSLNDWVLVDLLQGLTGMSLQHFQTVKNAIAIDKAVKKLNIPLYFCGHSLGGGLASSNAIATGREAITFNAAGLNFIGGCWTRLYGALGNDKWKEAISPWDVANKVHPIRIDGEAVDVLMLLSKPLTVNFNQRGYGRYSLVLQNVDLGIGGKHGINNFLYNNIMNELKICRTASGIRKITNVAVKSSSKGIPTSQKTLSACSDDKYMGSENKFMFNTDNDKNGYPSAGILYFRDLIS